MRRGDYPGFSGVPVVVMIPGMRKASMSKPESDDGMREGELGMKCFEDEGRNLNQGIQRASRSWKRQGGEFSLKSPKGTHPANA